jgi:hypothetical protein
MNSKNNSSKNLNESVDKLNDLDADQNKENFTITVHMVTSLDGFIAKKDNSISWFETTCNYENGLVELRYSIQ